MDNKLISAQQGEVNAALMYREFARLTNDAELNKIFLDSSADEGKHAALLSKYTNQKLKPNTNQAKLLGIMYKLLPKKVIFYAMYKGEYSGGNGYKAILNEYPEFEDMMNDEYRHGNIFKNMLK